MIIRHCGAVGRWLKSDFGRITLCFIAILKGNPMDLNFWRRLWDNNEIGFHQSNVNGLLADYFHMLKCA